MPLGDSITQGSSSGVSSPAEWVSYRQELWDQLITAGFNVDFVGSEVNGENVLPAFDADHAAWGGIRDDQIASLLDTGINPQDNSEVTPGPYLETHPADFILLHIGTNNLNSSPDDVAAILDEIDEFEVSQGFPVTVLLARIVNRLNHVCPNASTTTTFNNNVDAMAQTRIGNGDRIVVVDMECGAGLDYQQQPAGDMFDTLHPFATGYVEISDVWFQALSALLDDATPPSAPTNLVATPVSGSEIDLSWNPASDPDSGIVSYRIERDGVLIATVPATQTTYSDSGLQGSTLYEYGVSAVNGSFTEGPLSNLDSATTFVDLVPPTIVSLEVSSNPATLRVFFSEPMEQSSAELLSNYGVSRGGAVTSATLEPDMVSVTLSLSGVALGAPYLLAVSGVEDQALIGNPIAPGTSVAFSLATRLETDVVALYDFEEGSGDTVHDVSGIGVPLDLTLANPAAATWLGGALSINTSTIVQSAFQATKVIDACVASNEISVEAWVRPANTTQGGPARMVTVSGSGSTRNFTLGQRTTDYRFRLRTTTTSGNGLPSLVTPTGVASTDLTHVVYTRSAAGDARIYVDGAQSASGTVSGDFSSWTSSYTLALANEISAERSWLGELHLVAIHDRALSSSEVLQNFEAGESPAPPLETGDFDEDGDVDADDFAAFNTCFQTPGGAGCLFAFEFTGDGVIDCADWSAFALAWTAPGEPPPFAPCAPVLVVPAMTPAGGILLGLAIVAAGGWSLARGRHS